MIKRGRKREMENRVGQVTEEDEKRGERPLSVFLSLLAYFFHFFFLSLIFFLPLFAGGLCAVFIILFFLPFFLVFLLYI